MAQALAQVGNPAGALSVAEKIKDQEDKAQTLSVVAQALAQAGDGKALEIFRRAIRKARLVSLEAFFESLGNCTALLVDLDGGETLREIFKRMDEVEGWWGS